MNNFFWRMNCIYKKICCIYCLDMTNSRSGAGNGTWEQEEEWKTRIQAVRNNVYRH